MKRISTPSPPHNSLYAPAVCGCVDCSRIVLNKRCPKDNRYGDRCGNYRGHASRCTVLVATAFIIAEERVRLDSVEGVMTDTATSETVVIENYFAQWRQSNGRMSAIHWFKKGYPACGSTLNEDSKLHPPPEPILTCGNCRRLIKKRDAAS